MARREKTKIPQENRPIPTLSEIRAAARRCSADDHAGSFTVHWILDHVQEREIHRRAQLNLYLRLLGIEPSSI
jgi:uncharacterized damage-inducible protein DinB